LSIGQWVGCKNKLVMDGIAATAKSEKILHSYTVDADDLFL
jgi:hypothetical protein